MVNQDMTSEALTFGNSFWGEGDTGLSVLYPLMKQSKGVSDQLAAFFKERSNIEEDYAKRLQKLAKSFTPAENLQSLGDAFRVVRAELEMNSRVHMELSNDLRSKIEKPLCEFIATQSTFRKNV
jgi:Fes/CIP4, and EFC/F-BAR homology domain